MNIERIIQRVIVNYPFFASIVANIDFCEDNSIPTALTNGKTIYYNLNYLKKISEEERKFVFAHELSHIAFNHINRSKGKNPHIWNIATDAVINAFLKQDNIPLVNKAIDIEEAINYTCDELYNILLENDNLDYQCDNHQLWDDCQKDDNEEVDERVLYAKSHQLKEKIFSDTKVKDGLSRTSHLHLTNNENAKISWQKILQRYLVHDYDWTYHNALIEDNVLIPYLEEINTSDIEIILDASGSISDELLKEFLKECQAIVSNSKIKIGFFDTIFYGFTTINNFHQIEELTIPGGGGTDFYVALKSFSKSCPNKILFTDGLADDPNIKNDIIWIIYHSDFTPKYGRCLHLDNQNFPKSLIRKKS